MHSLIVCGGTPPTKRLLEQEISNADLIVGADSGGYALLGYGFTPDLVIGDMDSFAYTNHEGINILEDPDQETNDLEKALSYVLEKGYTSCVVLGTLGKRIDHTMKNLSVFCRYWHKFESLIYRDDYGDTILTRSPFEQEFSIGTKISFFPVGTPVEEFTSTGLKYPLTNSRLEFGGQDGTSNEVTEPKIRVTFKDGFLGVFIGNGQKMKKG